MATVTLNQLYAHDPCKRGWNALLNHVGKIAPDDDPVPMNVVLDAIGLMPAIWCIRAIEGEEEIKTEFNEFMASSNMENTVRDKFLQLFGE